MKALFDWVWANRQWTLSGVAVAVPLAIFGLLTARRRSGAGDKRVKQSVKTGSDFIQATDVTDSVVSVGQSGGITAGTLNVSLEQQRTLLVREVFAKRPEGAEYHTQLELTVQAAQQAANLVVQVEAPTVQRVELLQPGAGIVSMSKGLEPGRAWVSLQRPFGLLVLDVFTAVSEDLGLRWEFQ